MRERMPGTKRKTFLELQRLMLKSLVGESKTAYGIAKANSIRLHVVKHQLILLKGKDLVSLVFERKRFRLYSITEKGLKLLGKYVK
ncbi:MAG: hypothetical protein U9O94_09920 [Nanoarchaeota archaeon]|nr:hypothetical protein [Nanoarchaeota archaeon]